MWYVSCHYHTHKQGFLFYQQCVWWVSLGSNIALEQLIFRLSLFLSVISELLSLHCATSLCRFSLSFFFLSLEMNWADCISFSFIITGLKDTRSASFRTPPQFLLLLSAQGVFDFAMNLKVCFQPKSWLTCKREQSPMSC